MYRLLAALAIVASLVTASPANAASPSAAAGANIYRSSIEHAANPQAAFAALSPTDQQSVRLATALTHVTSTTSATFVDPAGCGSITVVIIGHSLVTTIWHWNVYLYVCTNGTQVYYRVDREYPSSIAPLWNYVTDGFPVTYHYGWSGYTYYSEAWSQAHFEECFGPYGIGCVDNVYPYADARINGNLSYSYSGGT